jgi:hypothetical protein
VGGGHGGVKGGPKKKKKGTREVNPSGLANNNDKQSRKSVKKKSVRNFHTPKGPRHVNNNQHGIGAVSDNQSSIPPHQKMESLYQQDAGGSSNSALQAALDLAAKNKKGKTTAKQGEEDEADLQEEDVQDVSEDKLPGGAAGDSRGATKKPELLKVSRGQQKSS